MRGKPTVLLADADVLIDYRESDLAILALVARHLARITVLPPVLDEVRGVTATECARLGIEIVEVETERMLLAGAPSIVAIASRYLIACRFKVQDFLPGAEVFNLRILTPAEMLLQIQGA